MDCKLWWNIQSEKIDNWYLIDAICLFGLFLSSFLQLDHITDIFYIRL